MKKLYIVPVCKVHTLKTKHMIAGSPGEEINVNSGSRTDTYDAKDDGGFDWE